MKKKILVVGGGGREHAIISALKKSPHCAEIWCAPGNGGIAIDDARCKDIKATDVDAMVAFAEENFDYAVVAQDDPLALGMVDALAAVGIPAFGPTRPRRIEASKVFSKDLMKKYGIPTAKYETFDDPRQGHGVHPCRGQVPGGHQGRRPGAGQGRADLPERAAGRRRRNEIMLDKKFGASGNHVVVEEFLTAPRSACCPLPTARPSCPWCPPWTTSVRWTTTTA